MTVRRSIGLVSFLFCFIGCATTRSPRAQGSSGPVKPTETRADVQSAVEAVADAMINPSRSAKYCPVCGRHYSSRLEFCPVDQTKLKEVEE